MTSSLPESEHTAMELRTLPDAAREAGTEYRTLHSWVQRGILVPTRPSAGAGHPALLSPREVDICGMLQRLREAGCGLAILTGAARAAQHRADRDTVELHSADGVVVTASVRPPDNRKAPNA